jgi:alpha-glucosidase
MLHTRAYELRLVGDWPPSSVTVNGAPVHRVQNDSAPGWRYDGNTLTTIVRTTSFTTTTGVNIAIKISPELARQASLLDGFAGRMVRLRETYDILNQSWPEGWTPNEVVDAMQTGDRITYHPETALTELTSFAQKVAALPKQIEDMHAIEQSPKFQAAVKANLFGQSPTHPNEDPIARFHRIIDLALAHSADLNGP